MRLTKSVLNCEKVVSHRRRFVAILVPKVGSQTLVHALTDRATKSDFQGQELRLGTPEVFTHPVLKDYFTFGFVRDPWTRVASCYVSKVLKPKSAGVQAILDRYEGLEAGMPFDAFVRWLHTEHGRDEIADRHWASQYHFLSSGERAVDFVGRQDRLQETFDEVCRRVGVEPVELPRRNSSRLYTEGMSKGSANQKHLESYTPELVELVAQRYAEDVERYGFEAPVLDPAGASAEAAGA